MNIADKTADDTITPIHYLETGPVSGRDIILLHGMKFNAETWQETGTLTTLTQAGHHGIALELPGFGKSPAADVDPLQVLEDFINCRKIDQPIIIGPSMGGRVALEFAVSRPHLVGGLVLVGAVGVEENRNHLAGIDLPTLIVWGGEDAISPIANGHLLHQQIKGSSFFEIEHAPHPCYLDQPAIWHEHLMTFLANLGV